MELSQATARSQEFLSGFPYSWLDPNYLSLPMVPPGCALAEKKDWKLEIAGNYMKQSNMRCRCLKGYFKCRVKMPAPYFILTLNSVLFERQRERLPKCLGHGKIRGRNGVSHMGGRDAVM